MATNITDEQRAAVPANVLADMQAARESDAPEFKDITDAPFNVTVSWFALGKPPFKDLAEALNMTQGRAAEYVRRMLKATGHEDLSPRGRSTGSSSGTGVRKVTEAEAQVQALLEQAKEEMDSLQTRVSETQEAAGSFDPEAWIAAQAKAMQAQLDQLTERLEAWTANTDDVASKAADAEGARLRKVADDTEGEAGKALAIAESNVEKFETMLALLAETSEEPSQPPAEQPSAE